MQLITGNKFKKISDYILDENTIQRTLQNKIVSNKNGNTAPGKRSDFCQDFLQSLQTRAGKI